MKINKSSNTVSVDAPKGYHWMERNGRYFLMKHEGEFVPHQGASLTASFELLEKH